MAGVTRTISPVFMAVNRQPSSVKHNGDDSFKHLNPSSIILKVSQAVGAQNDFTYTKTAADKKRRSSAPCSILSESSNGSAPVTNDTASLSTTADDSSTSMTKDISLARPRVLAGVDENETVQNPPSHDLGPTSPAHKTHVSGGTADLIDTAPVTSTTGTILTWHKNVGYEASSMVDLGKNRYLAQYLAVPSEADTRFAQVKDILEADVRRLIAGVRHNNRILWSYRICMIGTKTGSTVTAEPTILISCGSLKCKRKIKSSFQRIRPHYLQGLGMSLIVRYDKSAPVLAAGNDFDNEGDLFLTGGGAVSPPLISHIQKAAHYLGDDLKTRIVCIQKDQSPTTCGLKVMIKSSSIGIDNRAYATLGGIIKLGETWYGITAAHPMMEAWIAPSNISADDDFDTLSDDEEFHDSSDEDEVEDYMQVSSTHEYATQSQLYSRRQEEQILDQSTDFTELPDVWPGSRMSYTFNGECSKDLRSAYADITTSDWVIFEVPETFNRPNSYVDPSHITVKQRTLLDSVTGPSQMEPGPVFVLCNLEAPHVGHLTMTLTSLQLCRGAIEVYEIFLEKPMARGTSGSWVARDNQLIGMVIALSNGGLSCYIMPMWKVFENVKIICNQDVKLPGQVYSATETSKSGMKLEQEDKVTEKKMSELEEALAKLEDTIATEREQFMQQRQHMENLIHTLQHERDEAIRTKALEATESKRQEDRLQEYISVLEKELGKGRSSTPYIDKYNREIHKIDIQDEWDDGSSFIHRGNFGADGSDGAPISPILAASTITESSVPTSRDVRNTRDVRNAREYREMKAIAERNYRAAEEAAQRYSTAEVRLANLQTQLAEMTMRENKSKEVLDQLQLEVRNNSSKVGRRRHVRQVSDREMNHALVRTPVTASEKTTGSDQPQPPSGMESATYVSAEMSYCR